MALRAIYKSKELSIRRNRYNWILILNGDYRNPMFFGTLKSLFEEVLESKLKAKLKRDFKNLGPLLDSALKKIKNIADSVEKFIEKQ